MQTGTSDVTTDSNKRLAQSAAPKPKLLDQVRQAIGARQYSKRTENTYVPAPIRDENGKSENRKWQMENGPIYTPRVESWWPWRPSPADSL